jgi:hypothetical protein
LPGTRQRAFLTAVIERIGVGVNQIDIRLRPRRLSAPLDIAATLLLPSVTDDETPILCIPEMKEHRPMPAALPALNLIAEPGRRRATLDTAREIERRGFAGISVSSSFGNMSQSVGLALATERIPFATAIAPIYAQSVDEFAQNGAYLHEVSGGRFQFGIGIAHAPAYVRMEVKPGKPLGDIRAFVEKFKSHTEYGPLPPVILATLRKRMIALL